MGEAAAEEELKLLAPSREEMQSSLEALRGQIEASERQGQSLFNTAWSLIRSYIDRPPEGEEGEGGTGGGGGGGTDFVHVRACVRACVSE